jgi:hypothetical protein
MKHLNMTSLLARIALERDDELLQLTAAMSDGKKTSGNPMAIRFKPAVGILSSSCQVVWVSRLRLS